MITAGAIKNWKMFIEYKHNKYILTDYIIREYGSLIEWHKLSRDSKSL